MKTSNIIIIAFATFILAGMLFLFVDSKQHQNEIKANITFKINTLPVFSVVVAEKGSIMLLEQSDSSYVKIEYVKDKPTPKEMYKVKNDTLYVNGGLFVYVKCQRITSIIGNKPSWLKVNGFVTENLRINMRGGYLEMDMYKSNDKIKSSITKLVNLDIVATDSANVELRGDQVQKLSMIGNNSSIRNRCKAKNVTVKLENKSKLYGTENFDQLIVQKDSTSLYSTNY